MKYMFNIVVCQGVCEPMCFKLGTMLKTAKLHSFIAVWMTLVFTQGHGVTKNLEFVESFCWKVAWSSSKFPMVDFLTHSKEDDCEVLKVWQIGIIWAFALLVMTFWLWVVTIIWQNVLYAEICWEHCVLHMVLLRHWEIDESCIICEHDFVNCILMILFTTPFTALVEWSWLCFEFSLLQNTNKMFV